MIKLSSDDLLVEPLTHQYERAIISEDTINKFFNFSRKQSRQPVFIFGANWCPDCLVLDGVLKLPTIKKFINTTYEVLHIGVGDYSINMDLMNYLGDSSGKGLPLVLIFNKGANLLNGSKSRELRTARNKSYQDIFDYFQSYAC
ncbi:MAG: thioredoxin family protein [Proteobacteria bacterium]|nr:thioredoxin family protein [Pseudomonadota bacterium]